MQAGYGDTTVLTDITLSLPVGQRLAMIGRNGVGKTTLMHTIMGLTRPHGGAPDHNSTDISAAPSHRRATAGIGLVPQRREEAHSLFPRLKERRRNSGGQLSGGER